MSDWLLGLPSWLWRGIRRVRVTTILAVLAASAGGWLVLSVVTDDEEDLRAGSEVVGDRGTPLDASVAAPGSYRIVYRIENRAAGDLVIRTEEAWIRRPFDGRVDDDTGERSEADDTTPDVSTITRFGSLTVESTRAQPLALDIAPNPAVADVRPVAALEAARKAGDVELRERRRISRLDRQCQVYRLGAPVGGGALVAVGTTEGEYADVCVDRQGFVLEEVSVVDGDRILSRRLAVALELDPDLPADLFRGPEVDPAPADQGGGSVLAVDPTSRPPGDRFFELSAPPDGFTRRGRYAVIPPQAQEFADPLLRSQRVAGVVDVWENGPDFIAVDQSGTLGGVKPFDKLPHTMTVEAGQLGEAELVLGLRTSEVRVALGAGRYVRVYGTVRPDVLLEVARSLEPEPGGELVYLEQPPAP